MIIAAKAEAQSSALAIADSLYAVGNYSAAIKQLQKVPLSAEVQIRLARAQKAKGDISAALDTYQKVLRKDQGKVLAALEYAKLLSASGKLKDADSLFTLLIEKDRMNPDFHYQLGLVKEKLKDSTAIKEYELAVILNQTHQKALVKVATYNLSRGKFIKVELLCKQGLKANPANVSLLSLLAQAFYHMDDYKLAIEEFQKLINLGAGNEFIHSKMARAYVFLKDYNKAIQHYNRALDYNQDNYATHYSLGKLYAVNGEYRNSEGHLLTAILLKDQSLDAEFLSLGLTYKLSNQPQKAFKYLNKALQENPDNERALFEKAITADHFYKDLKARMEFYQSYLDKYSEAGTKNFVRLAQIRLQDIREEIHLNAGEAAN